MYIILKIKCVTQITFPRSLDINKYKILYESFIYTTLYIYMSLYKNLHSLEWRFPISCYILSSYTCSYSIHIQLFIFFFLYLARYIICFRCISCRHISFSCLCISFLFSLYTLSIRRSITLLFNAFFSLSLCFLFTFVKGFSNLICCILQLICTLNSKIFNRFQELSPFRLQITMQF